MTNDDPPLCFAISTIFRDNIGERVGEASDPICMYRCDIYDDCNFYLEFDEDELNHIELDVCAGQDVEIHEGCFDNGFCSSRADA